MLNDQVVIVIFVIRLCLAIIRAIDPGHGCEVHYFGTFEKGSKFQIAQCSELC